MYLLSKILFFLSNTYRYTHPSIIKSYEKLSLELMSDIFIFLPNDSPSETMKSTFYFIQKALFIVKKFNFL